MKILQHVGYALTSELLDRLNSIAIKNSIHTDHESWPQSADSLTKKLKIISSNLREGLGINISVSKIRSGSYRGRSLTKVSQNALHATRLTKPLSTLNLAPLSRKPRSQNLALLNK